MAIFEIDFSIGIKMGIISILSLWISHVYLSEAIVHFGQELDKSIRGKITGLILLFYFI